MKRSANQAEIRELLETEYRRFNTKQFIEKDPISVPHAFSKKEDVEISAFLAATLAWGNRASILKSCERLMALMDHAPYDFVKGHREKDLKRFNGFAHRTFNSKDCAFFMRSMQKIYANGGMERAFGDNDGKALRERIAHFRQQFLEAPHEKRSEKHISDPTKKSSAKRLCMFLRWMVRKDKSGVDFGLWKSIKPAELMVPLDVHSGNVARKLGLLRRRQNDWQAVEELTAKLREFDPADPVKYDLALFSLGVNKIL